MSAKTIVIDYTNYKGERRLREIIPQRLVFESNEWHPRAQWLLVAFDIEKKERRTFSMESIHSWHYEVVTGFNGEEQENHTSHIKQKIDQALDLLKNAAEQIPAPFYPSEPTARVQINAAIRKIERAKTYLAEKEGEP